MGGTSHRSSGGGNACNEDNEYLHEKQMKRKSGKRKQKKHHVHSNRLAFLCSEIEEMEKTLRRAGVGSPFSTISSLGVEHEKTPMLGHMKGNTASNRKVIKRSQEKELEKIADHLQNLMKFHDVDIQRFKENSEKGKKTIRIIAKPSCDIENSKLVGVDDDDDDDDDDKYDDWRQRWMD